MTNYPLPQHYDHVTCTKENFYSAASEVLRILGEKKWSNHSHEAIPVHENLENIANLIQVIRRLFLFVTDSAIDSGIRPGDIRININNVANRDDLIQKCIHALFRSTLRKDKCLALTLSEKLGVSVSPDQPQWYTPDMPFISFFDFLESGIDATDSTSAPALKGAITKIRCSVVDFFKILKNDEKGLEGIKGMGSKTVPLLKDLLSKKGINLPLTATEKEFLKNIPHQPTIFIFPEMPGYFSA